MQRRDFLTALGATALAAGADPMRHSSGSAVLADESSTPRRPDVLFLFTDQWNPRCLGYAGDTAVPTPNIDRLAAEGMIFDANYSPCPVCMPARASLLTGMYPHNFGSFSNSPDFFLSPEIGRMFQDIRAAGYATAQIGKLHWSSGPTLHRYFDSRDNYHRALGLTYCQEVATPNSTPSGHGIYQDHLRRIGRLDAYCRDIAWRMANDEYSPRPSAVEPEDHNDAFVVDRAIDFVRAQPADKPYCLVVSFPGPHPPLDAPGEYATLVPPSAIELPPNAPARFTYHGAERDRDSQRAMRANYYGKMAHIDASIGRILQTLRERGTLDDTLVIFSADHGEMMGAQGHMSKGRFYEESGRVPLVMRWPRRIAAGGRTAALSHLFDVYPTIVDAVGGTLSPHVFARSLLPIATGSTRRVWDAVFSEIGRQMPLNYMVRTEQFAWWIHNGKEALFDMRNDPYQERNLIASAEHRGVVEEMHARHWEYLRSTQLNYALGSKPLITRMAEENGGRDAGLAERIYQNFRRIQGFDRAP